MRLAVDGAAGVHEAFVYTGGRPFDRALPAVVFVHGAMHDHSVWTLLARWFAHHGFCVLAPDLPGHGKSAGPPLESVEAIAAWLLALQGAAGVDAASLVGHSMGSLVALEAAAQAPQRAQRLVMIGTASHPRCSRPRRAIRLPPSTASMRSRIRPSPPSLRTLAPACGCTAPTGP
jgi:pimeloyl-ACP methyl ester carboxylesterase